MLEIGSFVMLIIVLYECYEKIDSVADQVAELRDMVLHIDPDISLAFESNTLEIAESRITKMLNSIPADASTDQIEKWFKMKPLNIDMLDRYWEYVEEDGFPMFDIVNARYSEWTESVQIYVDGEWQQETFQYYGMRHEISGKPHGPVRKIDPDGNVYEGCFKEGKAHGLSRDLNPTRGEIALFVWQDNVPLA